MNSDEKYTKFELLRYYFLSYHLYRMRKKRDKYFKKLKKIENRLVFEEMAYNAGYPTAKEFISRIKFINAKAETITHQSKKSDDSTSKIIESFVKKKVESNEKTREPILKNEEFGTSAVMSILAEKEL